MAAASGSLHEPREKLRPVTLERHRAVMSLMEELEAIDWYDQRVDASEDAELAAVLAHNRDEEKEHAVMTLEWLRRGDPVLDAHLKKYLYSSGSIAGHGGGGAAVGAPAALGAPGPGADGSLGIGSLRSGEVTR